MLPLVHAAFGWVFVILAVQPYGGALDVTVDAVGWLGIAWGWHRLITVEPRFATARSVALVGAVAALLRLLPGPEVLLGAAEVVAAGAVTAAVAAGARALGSAAEQHGSPLVAAQSSFLQWAAVGALLVACGAGLGSAAARELTGLVSAAVLLGLGLAAWFTVLQLLSAGRAYLRVGGRS